MSTLQENIAELTALKNQFRQFIHGGLTVDISTDSGQWPSIPKAIHEATQAAASGVEQLKDDAEAAADSAADNATIATDAATLAQQTVAGIDQDKAATAADRVQTGKDRLATAADRNQTEQDVIAIAADRVETGKDRLATAADRNQTAQDVIATAADRVETGKDRLATAADRDQISQDVIATAADRVETGKDRLATAADRNHTAQDVLATGADLTASQAALSAAIEARNIAQQSASAVASGLFFAGGWDASTGNAPPTPANGAAFYRITAGGTIAGIAYTTKDEICYDSSTQSWFLVGGSTGVDSINGKTGIATLASGDVGAFPAASAGTAAAKNVAAAGDAGADEVVQGSDSRLSDDRTPKTHQHQISDTQGLESALASKLTASTVEDSLTSQSAVAPLSANQGKVLKGLIDTVSTLLTSDDASLDQLQEIVTFIKANKATLDSLGIAGVIGLQNELDNFATSINGLNTALSDKAPIDSPVFDGIPEVPTAISSTNSKQIASTAFVQALLSGFNPPASAPTAAQVSTVIAGFSSGGVGTYMFVKGRYSTTRMNKGSVVQGSNIGDADSGTSANTTGNLLGSWRVMGSAYGNARATLCLRIA